MTVHVVLVAEDPDVLALHAATLTAAGATVSIEVGPVGSTIHGDAEPPVDVTVVWTDDERSAVARRAPSARHALVVVGADEAAHRRPAVPGTVRLAAPVDPVTLRRVVADGADRATPTGGP